MSDKPFHERTAAEMGTRCERLGFVALVAGPALLCFGLCAFLLWVHPLAFPIFGGLILLSVCIGGLVNLVRWILKGEPCSR